MLSKVNFWPCLGNHDLSGPSLGVTYNNVFDLPYNGPQSLKSEQNYWFDYSSARFAVINTQETEEPMINAIIPWLSGVMNADKAWKFVVMHVPPYTSRERSGCARLRALYGPVFDRLDIDIVFSGHNHIYERTRPIRSGQVTDADSGVVYITTGAGGHSVYKAPQQHAVYSAKIADNRYSFTQVKIDGGRLDLKQAGIDGRILDTWYYQKHQPSFPSSLQP